MYLKFVNNDPSLPESWKIYFNQIGDEADIIVNEIICVDEIIAFNKGIYFEFTLIKVWTGKKLNCRLVTQILS